MKFVRIAALDTHVCTYHRLPFSTRTNADMEIIWVSLTHSLPH